MVLIVEAGSIASDIVGVVIDETDHECVVGRGSAIDPIWLMKEDCCTRGFVETWTAFVAT